MKPDIYDDILLETKNGCIYKFNNTILFYSKYEVSGKKFELIFNAAWIPKAQYKWFCDVCGKNYIEDLDKMFEFAQKTKMNEIKNALEMIKK